MSDIIGKSSEATKGGFKAVKRVEGTLLPIKRVPSRFTEEDSKFGVKDQAEIVLEDALIVEMEPGEPEPELKDDRFVTWMTYAAPGKEKPNVNTFFVKHFMTSGEKLDAKRRGVGEKDGILSNVYGTRVVLERQNLFLFKKRKEGSDPDNPEYEEFFQDNYVIVECEEGGGADVAGQVKAQVLGNTLPTAKRNLLTSGLGRRFPEYKTALDNGTLAELLGLVVADGKFAEKES